eukprot:681265-Pelagomonas_calceolata.AAC.2
MGPLLVQVQSHRPMTPLPVLTCTQPIPHIDLNARRLSPTYAHPLMPDACQAIWELPVQVTCCSSEKRA